MDTALVNKFKAATSAPERDTTRVHGYSAGVPNLAIRPRDSGLTCDPLTGGVLLTYAPGHKTGYLGGLTDRGYARLYVNQQPWEGAHLVNKKFHEQEDFGYRNLPMLKPLAHEFRDGYFWDEAQEYFDVVHPLIRECPFGLNQKIQTTDPSAGMSELVWQHCPTCRLADLKSEFCEHRIIDASAHRNTEAFKDGAILFALRDVLVEACEAALTWTSGRSQAIQAEIQGRFAGQHGRATLNTLDFIHFKMQHKELPKGESATQIENMSKAMASAFKEVGVGAVPTGFGSPAEYEEYLAYKQRKEAMAKARQAKNKKEEVNESDTGQRLDV